MSIWLRRRCLQKVIVPSFAAVALLAIECGPAGAEKWVNVFTVDPGNAQVSIDVESIKVDGHLVRFWNRVVHSDGRHLAMTKGSLAVNCHDKTWAVTTEIQTDLGGRIISENTVPRPQWMFRETPPGSAISAAVVFVCGSFGDSANTPGTAQAQSSKHCTELMKRLLDATKRQNTLDVIQTTSDLEKECADVISKDMLANHIGTQASALNSLSRYEEAIAATTRCLRLLSIADCQLARGEALMRSGRKEEARKSLQEAKRLASRETSRATSELKKAASDFDREWWDLHRQKYRLYSQQADRLLVGLDAQPDAPAVYTGTGIAISADGRVLTNHHVVAKCRSIDISSRGKQFEARLKAVDAKLDLAVLETGASFASVAAFRSRSAEPGETVIVIGYPLLGILSPEGSVSFGHIAALVGIDSDWQKMQISAPVQPGNSGGPLLDQSGLLLGVVVQKLDALKVAKLTGDIPQNINFAIKAEVAQLFLQANGIQVQATTQRPPLTNIELARMGKDLTVLVRCSQ